ncbi:5nuc-like protein [Dermatophagoides farinae]|uniref:5'-nucleotidase n=1 Tax=Dermatophagoides farinae TaxID=6954 RepID=A0A9D4SFT2_DERFA|nr:5nuc-like protein [Dermatophagoides farinae]
MDQVIQWLILFKSVASDFRLTIIHNNDFHANYLPIKWYNNAECFEHWDNDTSCVGGVARTVAKVKEIRQQYENNDDGNVLFLNAGDHFQGTSWYTLLKSKVVADFVKLMKHDVMTLGNHEFDDGPEELKKFLNLMNGSLPIVCCNVDFDQSLGIHSSMVEKSIVINIKNTKVAIIGYLTPDTRFLSSPGEHVKFRDEIQAIQEEIQSLKAKHPDLNIFIGLGHSGYDRDIEIAEKIPDLDVIVGGHSHTYLYSGKKPPSIEKPNGPYPTIYEHAIKTSNYENNETTLIVQAFALGKYIGILNLTFNDDGQIVEYSGEPILLTHNSTEDAETKERVQSINKELAIKYNETFGMATEEFTQNTCRSKECTLGNLITDSFVDRFIMLQQNKKIRKHSCQVMNIDCKWIRIIENFENSAEQHDRGGFLQISGARVTYSTTPCKTVIKKSKLINVEAFCNNQWTPIEKENTFQVIINSFMSRGGDNYTININKWLDYQLIDREVLSEYIRKRQNVTPKVEDRIQFIIANDDNGYNSCKTLTINSYLISFVMTILIYIILSQIL